MSAQLYKCHKCDFDTESEEKIKMHMLFEHQFYMPNCSTDIAYQANTDFIRMLETRLRWLEELPITRDWIIRENIHKDGTKHSMIRNSDLKILENRVKFYTARLINNELYVIVHENGTTKERKYYLNNEHIRNYIGRYINLINLERRMKSEGVMF